MTKMQLLCRALVISQSKWACVNSIGEMDRALQAGQAGQDPVCALAST